MGLAVTGTDGKLNTPGAGGTQVSSVGYDFTLQQSGLLVPQVFLNTSTVALVNNRVYLTRFVVSRNMSVTEVAYSVTVAASVNDNVDVGIYTVASSTTLAKLATAGSTASKLNATGIQTVPIVASLVPGTVYYAALTCIVGGTAATLLANSFGTGGAALFGAHYPQTQADSPTVGGGSVPLPASLTWLNGAAGGTPILAVREA